MATFLVNGISRGLSDFRTGHWGYGDVSDGFRSGHGNVTSYQKTTKLNQTAYESKYYKYEVTSFALSTWKIFKTTLKALRLAPTTHLFRHHTTAIKTIACSWVGLNALALRFGVKTRSSTKLRDITLWKATPFLLLALNVFLTTLELRTNPRKVLINYAVLALSIADEAKFLPEQFSYVMNTILPLPMRAVSIYYTDSNMKRLFLTVEGIVPFLLRR